MPIDLKELVTSRLGENYDLHERYINTTLVKVQRTIGFDKIYAHAQGAYLYDMDGRDYLDFLSGYSVYNIGRNHPALKKAITDVLELDLPNMVQMDCSILSGLLAEALVKKMPPHLDALFFCNSGTEAIEGALKFAKAATERPGFLSLEGAFHGLSNGSLSLMGIENFREGFAPFLPECQRVELGNLERLEKLLATKQYAAFVVELVQGKGVKTARDDFFNKAQALCREHGTLFICDEIQTGLGRTGRMFAFEHWNLEPDIVTLAKSLSGGYVPCGAIVMRREIHQKTFSQLDRCVVHSSTFGRNNLAMACGLATLSVIDDERLVENAASMGALLQERLNALKPKHPFIKEVRGMGLMLAIEFDEPKDLKLKMAWQLIHRMDKSLFTQMVVTSLLSQHRILTQVAGHNMDVVKILPPLVIGEKEVDRFVNAFDAVLADCKKIPGPIWELGKNFFKSSLGFAKSKVRG
jgi:acetylornithine/succinyldiaminopimelate/putrescine aminotransferase